MKSREELFTDLTNELFYGGNKVFLTGSGGTGKSHTIRQINDRYKSIMTSTTGVSAIIINGQTLHSFFKLGFAQNVRELDLNDKEFLKKTGIPSIHKLLGKLKRTISESRFIMIDEVSMMNHEVFDMIMHRLYTMKLDEHPILMSGDFMQLPPVEGKSIMTHPSFLRGFKIYNLNKIYRTSDDVYIDILNKLRMGDIDVQVANYMNGLHPSKKNVTNPLYLYPTNRQVDLINIDAMDAIKSNSVSYSLDYVEYLKQPSASQYDTFVKNCKLDEELELKEGARVMCLRNLPDQDVVNGDTGYVVTLENDRIEVMFDRHTMPIWIEPVAYEYIEYSEDPKQGLVKNVLWAIKGMPLTVAYALTIHKAQGSSLDNIFIESDSIFSESQMYVAMSRAVNPDNMVVNYDLTSSGVRVMINKLKNVNKLAKKFYSCLPNSCQYE